MKIQLKHSAIQKCSQACLDDIIGQSRTIGAFSGNNKEVTHVSKSPIRNDGKRPK